MATQFSEVLVVHVLRKVVIHVVGPLMAGQGVTVSTLAQNAVVFAAGQLMPWQVTGRLVVLVQYCQVHCSPENEDRTGVVVALFHNLLVLRQLMSINTH